MTEKAALGSKLVSRQSLGSGLWSRLWAPRTAAYISEAPHNATSACKRNWVSAAEAVLSQVRGNMAKVYTEGWDRKGGVSSMH